MMRSIIPAIVLLASCIFFPVSFLSAAPKRGGTLQVAVLADAWSLDPIYIQTITGVRVFHDAGIGEALYDWSVKEGRYIPRLATSLPRLSNNNKTYIIPIRKGVKFHNGTQLSAHSMVYSIQRILNKDNKSYLLKKYSSIIEKAEAIDDYTLKISLVKPDNAFMAKLASRDLCPVSKAAVEKAGKEYGINVVVGTGPFRFVEWLQGDRIVIKRFEGYWDKRHPYLDEIHFKIIPEESTALMQLRLGEVHILEDVPRKYIKTLREDKNVTIKLITGVEHEQIYLNTSHPPFDDIRVRKAFAHAIDREAIIEGVFDGYAIESVGPYHPWFWTHNPKFEQPYPYNPEKAKKLLKAAGYGPDNPLKFEIIVTNQNMFIDQAILIQSFLADIGVNADILPLDKSALFDRVYIRKAYKGKPEMYQAALEDWSSSVSDPESAAERLFTSNSGSNKVHWGNSRLDELFQKVNFAKTIAEQKKIYFETERIIAEGASTVWICNPKDAIGYTKQVKGFEPDSGTRLPLMSVWLE